MNNHNTHYEDQSAYGLILNVVEGELEKNQFSMLTNEKIILPEFRINASIIGASHIITFKNSELEFHEIFACTDVETKSRLAYCGPLKKVMGRQCLNLGNSVRYEFNINLLPWELGQSRLAQLESQIRMKGGKQKKNFIGSEFCFPCGKDGMTPKTIIMVQANNKGVFIKTLHSYPNEGNLVFTETQIHNY